MKGLLMLALVMLTSDFGVPAGATNFHAASDLHRSMARYRQFFQHEDTTTRSLLQIDEKTKDKLDPAGDVNSIDPDPEKNAVKVQPGLDLEVQNQSVQENENSTDKTSTEQQHVDKEIIDETNTTDERSSIDTDDKFQPEQDLIEALESVKDTLKDNPKDDHVDNEQQQQVKQKVEGDTDVAGEKNSIDNNPEKQVGEFQLGKEDVVEEDVPVGKSRNASNPKHQGFQVQERVDEKPHDDEEISTDRDPQQPVKEGQVRPDAIEGEPLSGNQEVENFDEQPLPEETIDNSDLTRKDRSTGLESREKTGNESQLGQDVLEKQIKPDVDNSTETQTDTKVTELQLGQEVNVIQASKQETVQGKVSITERTTEENSDGNQQLDRQQQQEEGQKKGEEVEQEEDEVQQKGSKTEEKEPFVFPEPYLLGPKITDWDEQRAEWFEQNPHTKSADGKPKVLIVTGSQPEPCRSSVGDYFHIQSLKLKIDYARMHNYEIYYSFAWLDPLFGSYWVKLPIIRKLMLTHPEIEWFFWIDSDAMFTDMLFEAPFHTYEGYNMVMWGWNYGVYGKKLWTAFNAGVFIIRNCQWSLDLIDKWSPMGPDGPVREEYGYILSAFLTGRDEVPNYPADDQSALVYLMITDEAVKAKVKLVEHTEYMISGWWIDTVPLYNTSIEKFHPGFGDYRWPFITHFTGCSPCGGDQGSDDYHKCMESFQIAYNFADNQVLAFMGFQHDSMMSPNVTSIRNETGRPLELVGVNPWEERISEVAAEGTSGPR